MAAKNSIMSDLEQQLGDSRRQTEEGKEEVSSQREQLREIGAELANSRSQCDQLEHSVSCRGQNMTCVISIRTICDIYSMTYQTKC